jgi:hypothetical protein
MFDNVFSFPLLLCQFCALVIQKHDFLGHPEDILFQLHEHSASRVARFVFLNAYTAFIHLSLSNAALLLQQLKILLLEIELSVAPCQLGS